MHLVVAGSRLDFELLILGKLGFLLGDESVFHHPVDDVALAQPRALRVADGVVGGGCFGQTCQHGRLGNRDVFQRLAIVGFGRGRKAVRAIAQKNLVHVNFENLVLAQHVLQLEGQQNLVNLAGEGLFRRQVDIARHLHGDGGCALTLGLAHICQSRAQHAQIVYPSMLVEPGIFNGEHRIGHDLGNLGDGCQIATLFAEFGKQVTFSGKNSQWKFGAVVRQIRNIGQIGEGHG